MEVQLRVPQPKLAARAEEAGMEPVRYLVSLMERHGTRKRAASAAGVTEFTLRRWFRRYDLKFKRAS